jgi:hypothetical protein
MEAEEVLDILQIMLYQEVQAAADLGHHHLVVQDLIKVDTHLF